MHSCSLIFWLNYTVLSMTVMVTLCLLCVVGKKLVMSYGKFPQAPFYTRPFWLMPSFWDFLALFLLRFSLLFGVVFLSFPRILGLGAGISLFVTKQQEKGGSGLQGAGIATRITSKSANWEKLNRGVSKPGCFAPFLVKVQIVSRTLSGLFLVGALNRPRKRNRTNRENPRTIPEQIGKIPEKSGKSQKGQKRKDKSRSGNAPV